MHSTSSMRDSDFIFPFCLSYIDLEKVIDDVNYEKDNS